MALTEQSEIDATLALMQTDIRLRGMFDKVVSALRSRGIFPDIPAPTEHDWLALRVPGDPDLALASLAHVLLLRRREASDTPAWVDTIRNRRYGF